MSAKGRFASLMDGSALNLHIGTDLAAIDAAEWDALAGQANPFISHAFLQKGMADKRICLSGKRIPFGGIDCRQIGANMKI